MVTVTNLYRKGFQVLKDDFTENSNGTVHFFDAGTSSPQTVYSDAAGSSSLGTSITLDSDGRTQTAVYIGTTDTKVEHRDSDSNVIFPAEDNIPGAEESVSSGYARPETPTNVKNATGTIDSTDAAEVFLCDATSGDFTLTLQESSSYGDGHPLTFTKTDSSSNTVTFNSTGSETLDDHGATSLVLRKQGESLTFMPDGSGFHVVSTSRHNNRLPRKYMSGCVLSLGGDSDHDIVVSLGEWRDDDNTFDLVLPSGLTKQIDAVWAEGDDAGGLDTGTVAATTLYYVHLIGNPSTGAIDVTISTSLATPTLPSGYTKHRPVGYIKTDSSSNIDYYRSFSLVSNGGPDLLIRYSVSSGTNGGGATSGSWGLVPLNDIEYNRLKATSTQLFSNAFTLPAGTYKINWRVPFYFTDAFKTRLYNSSDSGTVSNGSNGYSPSASGSAQADSHGQAVVTITENKTFQIQYRVGATKATDGLGRACSFGVNETYSEVEITKIDTDD